MIIIVIALCVGFGLAILPAIRADRADLHTLHHPNSNCPECEDK